MMSGGLGSLGLLVATWFVSRSPAPLWLLGRSGRVTGQDSVLQRLWMAGACISARRCDAGCAEEASGLAAPSQPLQGFLHAGGVLQDATVGNMTLARCRAVFAPKVVGLHNMDTMMGVSPMQSVVLFSSIASLLGGVGQANYSAANAALDAAASVRQAQGVAGSSVQWGTWAEGGMATRDPSTIQRATSRCCAQCSTRRLVVS